LNEARRRDKFKLTRAACPGLQSAPFSATEPLSAMSISGAIKRRAAVGGHLCLSYTRAPKSLSNAYASKTMFSVA
jgi:hypothetical protein